MMGRLNPDMQKCNRTANCWALRSYECDRRRCTVTTGLLQARTYRGSIYGTVILPVCFVWVSNLVSHINGKTWPVQEVAAEEDIWV